MIISKLRNSFTWYKVRDLDIIQAQLGKLPFTYNAHKFNKILKFEERKQYYVNNSRII